ncbi:hypothetical protein CGCFRS4_v015654 [Colletotrichum fructicola]|nr:hypothetical protein CGCFRS4_v015654 [Colletotrichum fructicola]
MPTSFVFAWQFRKGDVVEGLARSHQWTVQQAHDLKTLQIVLCIKVRLDGRGNQRQKMWALLMGELDVAQAEPSVTVYSTLKTVNARGFGIAGSGHTLRPTKIPKMLAHPRRL